MYTTYFGFQEEPFSLTPTSRLFYSNPVYEEAYAKLLQGIRERKGFIVLTGEVGTGKTTLIRRLIDNLQGDASVRLSFSYYSTLSFEELIRFACNDMGVTRKNIGELQAFSEFLQVRSKAGKTTALVIDEAQDIEEAVLEHLFRLSDSPHVSGKLLQVILVGQHPELEKKLSHSRFDALRHKVLFRCQLEHLKPEEVREFIYHRLRLVGYEREDLFDPDVIRLITIYSAGIPRLINLICDNALRTIHQASRKIVSSEDIQDVVTTLRLRGQRSVTPDESQPAVSQPAKKAATAAASRPTASRSAGGMLQSLVWGGAGFLFVLLGFLLFTMLRPTLPPPDSKALIELEKPPQHHTSSASVEHTATVIQQTPRAALVPSLNVNSPQVQQGRTVVADLTARYHNLRPIAWGLATSTPAVALIIPENEWRRISKEDRINLTLYLESLVPSVRANPAPYIEEFRTAPMYETFRTKLGALCADCWILATGHLNPEKTILFDKVIVQGDTLWERSPLESRGIKASEFRDITKTAR